MTRLFQAKSRPTILRSRRHRPKRITATSAFLLFIALVLIFLGTVVVVGPSPSTDQYVLPPLEAKLPQQAQRIPRNTSISSLQGESPQAHAPQPQP